MTNKTRRKRRLLSKFAGLLVVIVIILVTAGVTESELAALTSEATDVNGSELVLLEEQPVVEKRLVPYERVRFTKAVVTEERQVADQVRKERITTDYEPVAER